MSYGNPLAAGYAAAKDEVVRQLREQGRHAEADKYEAEWTNIFTSDPNSPFAAKTGLFQPSSSALQEQGEDEYKASPTSTSVLFPVVGLLVGLGVVTALVVVSRRRS